MRRWIRLYLGSSVSSNPRSLRPLYRLLVQLSCSLAASCRGTEYNISHVEAALCHSVSLLCKACTVPLHALLRPQPSTNLGEDDPAAVMADFIEVDFLLPCQYGDRAVFHHLTQQVSLSLMGQHMMPHIPNLGHMVCGTMCHVDGKGVAACSLHIA